MAEHWNRSRRRVTRPVRQADDSRACCIGDGLRHGKPISTRRIRCRFGFTLIELLVVIAIISLLTAILLPSLHGVTQLAGNAACRGHLQMASKAMSLYAASSDQYFAGPNTSGLQAVDGPSYLQNIDTYPTTPTQNFDWVSPTLGHTLGLSENQHDRLREIFNTELACPSNDQYYQEQAGQSSFSDAEVQNVQLASYSSPLAFHVVGAAVESSGRAVRLTHEDQSQLARYVQPTDTYRPMLSLVGAASDKVYLVEGARRVTNSGVISFNTYSYQAKGGNFALAGPAAPITNDPFWARKNRAKVFRHPGETMNQVFFDGHVESTADHTLTKQWDMSLYVPTRFKIIAKPPRVTSTRIR